MNNRCLLRRHTLLWTGWALYSIAVAWLLAVGAWWAWERISGRAGNPAFDDLTDIQMRTNSLFFLMVMAATPILGLGLWLRGRASVD